MVCMMKNIFKSFFFFPIYAQKSILILMKRRCRLNLFQLIRSFIIFPINIFGIYQILKRDKKSRVKSIDKAEKEFEIKAFWEKQKEKPLVVSLTSFPKRMENIHFTLYSLFNQTRKADRTVLWLAEEQFPQKEGDLPQKVIDFKKKGLEIRWCEDLRSYKKLIPALKAFPNANIVTADDDIYYPSDWLEKLYLSHLRHPECIVAHRTHRIKIKSGKIAPYEEWEKNVSLNRAEYSLFATGCGGVLYPPKALNERVFDVERFKELCPNADDIWFWATAVLNGTHIVTVENNIKELTYVDSELELGGETLYSLNKNGGNDQQLNNLLNEYPEILEMLKNE